MIEINQLVVLKKDPNNIIYKVKKIVNNNIELTGLYYRSKINVNIDDIEIASSELIELSKNKNDEFLKKLEKNKIRNKKYLLGRILEQLLSFISKYWFKS